jgi:hypothetical protein
MKNKLLTLWIVLIMIVLSILPINIVAAEEESLYQKWDGYEDSPLLTSLYPYQMIVEGLGLVRLILSEGIIYRNGVAHNSKGYTFKVYDWSNTSGWVIKGTYQSTTNIIDSRDYVYKQANYDIYIDSSLTGIIFESTTKKKLPFEMPNEPSYSGWL